MRTSPSTPWFLLAAALILVGAAWLRWTQIDRRPFHPDEGVQAYQTWQLLRGDGYRYDPADKHGPFLYYSSAAALRLTGHTAATLTDRSLRCIPLLAGLATLALLIAQARSLGGVPTLLAAALLATAPLTILYDTYFVQEAWFCFLSWALVFVAWRFLATPTLPLSALLGLIAGLMQATKETSVLHFAALGLAVAVCSSIWRRGHQPRSLLAALAVFFLIYLAFYSAGFTRWSGVIDGVRTYAHYLSRADGGTQSQPWHYYFSLLWPHTREGAHWGEPLLLAAALAGFLSLRRAATPPLVRFLAVFTVTLLLLYSAIPYKTPWLLLTPYVGLCLLAGQSIGGFAALWERLQSSSRVGAKRQRGHPGSADNSFTPPTRRSALLALSCVLAALLLTANLHRARLATDRYANDPRNPYLTQHTAADLTRLLATLRTTPPAASLAIVSPDHAWPLPWYLRERAHTGYFITPPDNLAAYDFVVRDTRLGPPPTRQAQVFGLRSAVLLWLYQPAPAVSPAP